MRTTCLFFGLLILVAGCGGPSSEQDPTRPLPPADEPGLKRFASGVELAAFLTELKKVSVVGPLVLPVAAALATPEGFSTTTIQEIGVDESDMVKTDGTYLYILKNVEAPIPSAQLSEVISQTSEIRS